MKKGIWIRNKIIPYYLKGAYSCSTKKLKNCPVAYSEDQLIDLIGMTQGTVNGKAFYSATPPMSVSSRGNSGV